MEGAWGPRPRWGSTGSFRFAGMGWNDALYMHRQVTMGGGGTWSRRSTQPAFNTTEEFIDCLGNITPNDGFLHTYVNVSGNWNVMGYVAWQHKSLIDYMANVTT